MLSPYPSQLKAALLEAVGKKVPKQAAHTQAAAADTPR